ncbi:MAG: intradiol ring-cleavage dioxygenase [Bacteroidetes bacterium]|nr:intradiol ring-cleavage dioxygenase [Bacteroidota bacterium]
MEQSRKKFLRNFFIGATSVPLILEACKKESTTSSGSGSGSGSGTCTVAPTETEGPYPTHSPSSYVRSDIRDGRTGVNLAMNITIKNTNNNCAALSGVIVDVWHCDKDGNYSEYGTGFTSLHFLRGRQTADANGLVSFTTIFPGWYTGRATHIHVHIYNAAGTSLKITQISFPEGTGSAVQTVNSTEGQAYGYTKGMSGYTYATGDNVFSDDTALVEQAVVTGSLAAGFVLTHTINVAG